MTAKKTIAIGGDHAGFDYKEALVSFLENAGYTVKNFGAFTADSVDYPDFAHPVASAVERGEFEYGILVCGSANGVAITANKHQGIRAAICWQEQLASLARQHNDANVLCIPARFIDVELAKAITDTFLTTEFEGGRHANRVGKISC
ncbi:ribose 5-phosphate isomerase B [Parapedobacter luteus]|uniref:Ribose 5-phosphate isomerase B n=1 Tax=Parapedobacter luteus TaxID=623280 RepID=A0A1T5ELF3_9SPHI|nr:ribose 5-phosphate isomerase B [Parapedobacter luteus]SKB84685.1 ribose 5-phosphate isomerase B [Parapedobacter luteus]